MSSEGWDVLLNASRERCFTANFSDEKIFRSLKVLLFPPSAPPSLRYQPIINSIAGSVIALMNKTTTAPEPREGEMWDFFLLMGPQFVFLFNKKCFGQKRNNKTFWERKENGKSGKRSVFLKGWRLKGIPAVVQSPSCWKLRLPGSSLDIAPDYWPPSLLCPPPLILLT